MFAKPVTFLVPALLVGTLLAASPASAQTADAHLARIGGFFETADVVKGPDPVECTLSGGTQTTCFSITVRPNPLDRTPGPWCPSNISDGADAGGIWFLDGQTVDVDGAFIASLAETYGDTRWQLFDADTGAVRFTGTLEACQAAARPDVDPAYQNYCVQCLPEYMPEDATITYVIPLEPVPAERPAPTNRTGSGVAFNGVRLDGPAPLDAILGAHTIAPFDDCGGHVNPHVGYHYHAVTDCLSGVETTLGPLESDAVKAHGGQIGIAMDGHAVFPHLLADGHAAQGLDACHGHEAEGLPYHYHAGSAGSNQILGCLAAQSGCVLIEGETVCDASRRPPRP
ncbi:YHYH protein [Roseibium sp.]|uniref:YHYH protein n=1 Tax=Roseibium sp. TaxID=1936156 RepID=UPI0032665E1A